MNGQIAWDDVLGRSESSSTQQVASSTHQLRAGTPEFPVNFISSKGNDNGQREDSSLQDTSLQPPRNSFISSTGGSSTIVDVRVPSWYASGSQTYYTIILAVLVNSLELPKRLLRRYSAFRDLHERLALLLELEPFPAPRLLVHSDSVRCATPARAAPSSALVPIPES